MSAGEVAKSKLDTLPLWDESELAEAHEHEAVDEQRELKKALECLLFVADKPLRLKDLQDALQISPKRVRQLIEQLRIEYDQRSGLSIIEIAGGYQMVTRPEYAFYVARLKQPRRIKLSRASLETLAIIAYKQPITHPEIEHIRGVDSTRCLIRLLDLKLIKIIGRKESPGRPYLYATTERFLDVFGLRDLSDLPPIEQWQPQLAVAELTQSTDEVKTQGNAEERNEKDANEELQS